MSDPVFKIGDAVVKHGGRYGGPGRIVGITEDLGDGYRLYSVAMRVERGYGEFVHVFPASVLRYSANGPATHRHKKRGTEYVLIGIGKMQAEGWSTEAWVSDELDRGRYGTVSVDMREVAIYRSVDDGSLWVRPREEFEDGRFEPLPAPKVQP